MVKGMRFQILCRILLCCIVLTGVSQVFAAPREFGAVEEVKLIPGDLILRARLDTGADHCSLNASDLEYFSKGTEEWVRFMIRNRMGEEKRYEFKILRFTKIKQEKGKVERRPVIRIGICMDSFFKTVDANLTDRSEYAYPMLIGRDYMTGYVTVNPARAFTSTAKCILPGDKKKKRK